MAYLAAKTSRIRFLTSVMVVTHRPAVLTAKLLTLSLMSWLAAWDVRERQRHGGGPGLFLNAGFLS